MINLIRIKNSQRIEDSGDLELGPVTILVGGNGSGKSSVLKAFHWGARCEALATKPNQNWSIQLDDMDFVPSREIDSLAHRSKMAGKNRSDSNNKSPITVVFSQDEQNREIELYGLGNKAGVRIVSQALMKNEGRLPIDFSAYIPGLAGVAESETILAKPILRRRATAGDSGATLRQVMLEVQNLPDEKNALKRLSSWVGKVIPGTQFWVRFNQELDSRIEAEFLQPSMDYDKRVNDPAARRPIEMAGTGLLQVTQIFATLLAFKPKLLLIDEPDAHLHPSTQELLIRALEEAAQDTGTQIILTTHSPRMVQTASPTTRLVWMKDGKVHAEGDAVRAQMGWGSLDKDIILFSEDAGVGMMQSLINQWPDLANRVAVWPCFGTGSLPSGGKIKKLRQRFPNMHFVVHRDSDFMSEADKTDWTAKFEYTTHSVPVWFTPGSDVEACFHSPGHIAEKLGISVVQAEEALREAVSIVGADLARTQFSDAYSAARNKLAGNTDTIGRWDEMGGFGQSTIKGKVLSGGASLKREWRDLKPLSDALKAVATKYEDLPNHLPFRTIYTGNPKAPLCPDLRTLLLPVRLPPAVRKRRRPTKSVGLPSA